MRIHFFTASLFAITKQAASKEAAEKRKLKEKRIDSPHAGERRNEMVVTIEKLVKSGTWTLPQWESYTDDPESTYRYRTRAELHDIVFGAMKQAPTLKERISQVIVNGLTYKRHYEFGGVKTVTILTDWVKNWYTQK